MKTLTLISFLILSIFFSCIESETKTSDKGTDDIKSELKVKPKNPYVKQKIDSSSILITVERGAFHYDKFILEDTLITFYPSSESFSEEHKDYNQISNQVISKETRNKFVKKIIEDGFFKLKNSYSSNSSCSSHLTVTVKFNNQFKKVVSEDFERECPELLKFIEQEIIRMHNKKLKRILLPG